MAVGRGVEVHAVVVGFDGEGFDVRRDLLTLVVAVVVVVEGWGVVTGAGAEEVASWGADGFGEGQGKEEEEVGYGMKMHEGGSTVEGQ